MKDLILIASILIFSACGSSEQPKEKIYQEKGIALAGYDPVAYFEQGEARMGLDNALFLVLEKWYSIPL